MKSFYRPLTLTLLVIMPGCMIKPPPVTEYNPVELSASSPLVKNLDRISVSEPVDGAVPLNECVQLAFQNRRNLSLADRRIATNLAQAREIAAQDYPQLNGDLRWQGRNNDATSMGAGDRTDTSSAVELSVPIYDFGRTRNRVRAQRQRAEAAADDAARLRETVRLAVSEAYFQVLEAHKQKRVVEQSINVLEEQLQIARDYFEQGLVARNDVLAAEVQLAERQQNLIRANNDIRVSLSRLNRIIGLPVTHETRLRDVNEVTPWHGSLMALFQRAIEQRADLKALQRRISAAANEYRAAAAEYTPDFTAFGQHMYSSDGALANQSWITIGVGVRLPFYRGGARQAQLARLENEIIDAVERRDQYTDDILLDVKDAYLRLTNAREQLPVAQKRIALGRENLQVTQDRYNQGLVTQTDVLAEEARLISARSDYFAALYSYHRAVARLRNVIGGPLPPRAKAPEDETSAP